jgi:hypothetical protein
MNSTKALKAPSTLGNLVIELFEEIILLKEQAESGEDLDADRGNQLMARVCAAVPSASREDVVRMNQLVQETMKVIADRHRTVGGELDVVNKGRKALNGYNHLRGFDTEQRLYKQV